jgi:molybdopterin-containing oxidoreductase family iron-sulfur binding subunit
MNENRRKFLKRIGLAAAGAGCGFPLLGAAGRALNEGLGDEASELKQWGMIIDVEKCLPEVRQACSEACHKEHNVPRITDENGEVILEEEVKWIWTESYQNTFPDQAHPHTTDFLKGQPILVLCNHCTNPPCTKVCPTVATWKRESDGIVMMDMHRCIGCRYCIAACPYGARSFNWRDPHPYIQGEPRPEFPTRSKGVVEKCNFCAERIREGREPACVEAAEKVPGGQGALTFGDLTDPKSEVSEILREKHTICRKVSLGTGPNVFYIV